MDVKPFVDISAWNTVGVPVDVTRLAAANVAAVGVRVWSANTSSTTDDEGYDIDATRNAEACAVAGIPWWPYVYVGGFLDFVPEQQAHFIANAVRLVGNRSWSTAPLMLDIETGAGLERLGFTRYLVQLRTALEAEGITDLSIYTRRTFWSSFGLDRLGWSDLPLITAHWSNDVDWSDDARQWDEQITRVVPQPWLPNRWADWAGWQIAGDSSNMGHTLGVSSDNIDLGLLRADTFTRWFGDRA